MLPCTVYFVDLCGHHIQNLYQFQMQCLRKIALIKWQVHVPDSTVLKSYNVSRIEVFLQSAQTRWCGHIVYMDDACIARQTLCGHLHHGSCSPDGQYIRYEDRLHQTNAALQLLNWKSIAGK